jgi:uncharacterized Zn finger protein
MQTIDLAALTTAIRRYWPGTAGEKARRYAGKFFDQVRLGKRIMAKVEGNHGIYTVSIEAKGSRLESACSCYIGKYGNCHHCQALALTFLNDVGSFKEKKPKRLKSVRTLTDLQAYLQGITLESLLTKLKTQGITQKAFAESIGMNPRHLATIKASELRHHYFHELGATKVACLWVLEHGTNLVSVPNIHRTEKP